MSDYTQKAINAAFYADPGLLRKLIDEGTFPKSLIDDTGILNTPFPIWRIPQCWEIAMGTDPSPRSSQWSTPLATSSSITTISSLRIPMIPMRIS